jgi:hypothetical protein
MKQTILCIAFCVAASYIQAATVQLSTADSPFVPGLANQGWYSTTATDRPFSDDYATGYFLDNKTETAGYVTFDLSNISSQVVSARLKLRAANTSDPGQEETLSIASVSTDAATLNTGSAASKAVVLSDLFSGGLMQTQITLGLSPDAYISIDLSPTAVAEINAKRGGFLSFGFENRTISRTPTTDEAFFTNSAGFPNFLELTTVPESSALPLAALGFLFIRPRD